MQTSRKLQRISRYGLSLLKGSVALPLLDRFSNCGEVAPEHAKRSATCAVLHTVSILVQVLPVQILLQGSNAFILQC